MAPKLVRPRSNFAETFVPVPHVPVPLSQFRMSQSRVSQVQQFAYYYRSRVTASYLSKVAYFNLPDLHLAPKLVRPRSNFAETFGVSPCAIRWRCLCAPKFGRFDTTRRVMDGRTDKLTNTRRQCTHNFLLAFDRNYASLSYRFYRATLC